jgi:hypothetical protein
MFISSFVGFSLAVFGLYLGVSQKPEPKPVQCVELNHNFKECTYKNKICLVSDVGMSCEVKDTKTDKFVDKELEKREILNELIGG